MGKLILVASVILLVGCNLAASPSPGEVGVRPTSEVLRTGSTEPPNPGQPNQSVPAPDSRVDELEGRIRDLERQLERLTDRLAIHQHLDAAPDLEDLESRVAALEGETFQLMETPESEADWHRRMLTAEGNANLWNVNSLARRAMYLRGGPWYGPQITMEPLPTWRERIDERITALEWYAVGGVPRTGGLGVGPPMEHLNCPVVEPLKGIVSQCDRRPLWLRDIQEHRDR